MNPGRLREKISFYEVSTTQNIYAGASATAAPVLTTRAAIKPINQNSQFAVEMGISTLGDLRSFTIRQRKGYTPLKNHYIIFDGKEFTIQAVRAIDNKDGDVFHDARYLEIIASHEQ